MAAARIGPASANAALRCLAGPHRETDAVPVDCSHHELPDGAWSVGEVARLAPTAGSSGGGNQPKSANEMYRVVIDRADMRAEKGGEEHVREV